jgi:exodeoxyribonuclease VII small subunit
MSLMESKEREMTAKRPKSEKGETSKDKSFESAMSRLEKIVDEMEQGKLKLEDMIAHFEEGQSLIGLCSKKLNEVERKVEKLVKRGEKLSTGPFDEGEGDGADEEDEDA